ncbi:MAG: Ribonuclease PH, partial [uncultured Nocardioides sp.]
DEPARTYPRRRPQRRPAPSHHDHPPLARPRGRLGAGRVRRHQGPLRGLCERGCAAVAQGLRPGMGDRGVRHAPCLDQHALGPRVGQGQDRGADPRDLAPHRTLPACRHRLRGPRGEHHRPGLRRAAGRRWDPHRGDHRGVRRAGRRRLAPTGQRRPEGRAADRVGGRGERGHHRRDAATRPALRGGRARRDRHERRDDRERLLRRGPGHRRGCGLRPSRARRTARPGRQGVCRPQQAAAGGAVAM